MITIEYLEEYIEGEPGPNFYWRGTPHDYLRLVCDLHPLAVKSEFEIRLNSFDYINVPQGYEVVLKSSQDGDKLCWKNANIIMMDIKREIWREILFKLLGVSFSKSHDYIDFDELQLYESANFIISSEF